MKKIIIALLILAVLVLSGCKNSITGGAVVCNKPYILAGNNCCLDENDNKLCDKDETEPQAEQVDQPKEVTEKPVVTEEPKTEVKEETVNSKPGEYLIKDGDTVTFEDKEITVKGVGILQDGVAATVDVDGVEREIYGTKTVEIINGLKVQILNYEQLKNSVLIKVEKFVLGQNEYLINTRTVLQLPGKPEVKIIDILDDGAIILHVISDGALDKLTLDEGKTATVQGITITNIEGFPRTISGIKIDKYAIIKVQ